MQHCKIEVNRVEAVGFFPNQVGSRMWGEEFVKKQTWSPCVNTNPLCNYCSYILELTKHAKLTPGSAALLEGLFPPNCSNEGTCVCREGNFYQVDHC